jgi:hypothetical protein
MESNERVDWVSKHNINVKPAVGLHRSSSLVRTGKTWLLHDDNDAEDKNRSLMRENLDWDSDDDNVVNIEEFNEGYAGFLGFQPYKEVVFLELESWSRAIGVAYHLNSSKFQYLGKLHPRGYSSGICGSFPYTPCLTGYLLKHF